MKIMMFTRKLFLKLNFYFQKVPSRSKLVVAPSVDMDVRQLTRDTVVGGLHVRNEVLATRLQREQLGVRDADRARLSARAAPVDVIGDVSRAANSVAHRQTATNPHSPVARRRHDDDVVAMARGVESFPLAVGARQTVCKST